MGAARGARRPHPSRLDAFKRAQTAIQAANALAREHDDPDEREPRPEVERWGS